MLETASQDNELVPMRTYTACEALGPLCVEHRDIHANS